MTDATGPDAGSAPGERAQLPSPRVASEEGVVGRQMEGIASAMHLQAEILKRLHDQQAEMGKTLQDTQRSEMMISSTRALNDSFSGMRRVQERLLDRIGLDSGRRWWTIAALIIGLVAIGGAIVWGVQELSQRVDDTAAKLDRPVQDTAAEAALAELEGIRSKINSMEKTDRENVLDRLGTLHERITALENERRRLQLERDQAREELGAERADVTRLEKDLRTLKIEAEASQKEVARLLSRTMADQTLIQELNKTVEKLRLAPVAAPAGPESETPPDPVSATGGEEANPGENPAPKGPGRRVVTPAFLQTFNDLLQRNRASEEYLITTAAAFDRDGLQDVVMEIRGRDGSLAKTVYADRMSVTLVARGKFLELDFHGGYINFRHGIGRTIKSPFFNNRYQIVVLGAETQTWIDAKLSFLRVK
ncbi:MAG: hypothetical protein CMJ83_03455 [Planctomycetes bacterium]|nr:hypothetical protein [Planctomycetota bacterium]